MILATLTSVAEEVATETFDFWAWLSNYLSAETIAQIISVVTMLASIIALVRGLVKTNKQKAMTTQEVCNQVMAALKTTNEETTKEMINKLITPLQTQIEQITPVLNAFAKVLALSQENTPESKLAILELLQSMGTVSNEVIEEAKEVIEEQTATDNAKKEEEITALTEIEEEDTTTADGRY